MLFPGVLYNEIPIFCTMACFSQRVESNHPCHVSLAEGDLNGGLVNNRAGGFLVKDTSAKWVLVDTGT